MATKCNPQQCKARTKTGGRCKNRAGEDLGGFCLRHRIPRNDNTIVTAPYCPPGKSLFRVVVPERRLHHSFNCLRTAAGSEPARRMLDDVYQEFRDKDGNFLEQFQTTGFDTRFFELYLFAYFSRSGFTTDSSHAFPDFVVERCGTRAAVEATTVNPPQGGVVKHLGRKLGELSEEDAEDYFRNELPIRFGSPLASKLQKRYWELDHCRDLPFVIAVEAFHDPQAHLISDNALINYLYGSRDSATWNDDGTLRIRRHQIERHRLGEKDIPSNFFGQPDTENISAIVFTNSGTNGKFLRMGFQHGFGCETVGMSRSGFWFNPHPEAMDPTFMAYNLDNPPFVEPWGQGLTVFHNPACKRPLPRNFFVDAVQGYIAEDKFVAEHPGWHPIVTQTFSVYVGPDKETLKALPWTQPPHVAVGAIPKESFMKLCPYRLSEPNPIAEEQGWYADETGSFLGVVARDKTDDDWTWVVLARDEQFTFRCIDVRASLPTRDQARVEVQVAIARLLASPRRIFAEGHPGGQ
ncbi:MAG TPA: hypothetical protein VGG64_03725 [Pirellulales bacterium]